MNQNSWYGWIPNFTGEETFIDTIIEFRNWLRKCTCNRAIFNDDGFDCKVLQPNRLKFWCKCTESDNEAKQRIKYFLRGQKEVNDDTEVLIYPEQFYDEKGKSNIVIVYRHQEKIHFIALLEGKYSDFIANPDNAKLIAKTSNIEFIKNGLTNFSIDLKSDRYDEEDVGSVFFRIIRDIYHGHTHHKHQDLLLKPIKAKNENEAIDKLINLYLYKIVQYHKEIKIRVDTAFIKYFSIVTFKDSEDVIAQAMGEMTYAESLVNLLKEKDARYLNRFETAKKSLEILHTRIKAKYTVIPILIFLPSVILPAMKITFGDIPAVADVVVLSAVFLLALIGPYYIILIVSIVLYLVLKIQDNV